MTGDEYSAKFQANYRVSGYGIDGVTVHAPCPFCAEPDFLAYRVIDAEEVTSKEAICKACGRGAKTVYVHGAATTVRLVQTRGDDPPSYLSWIEREP